jgi:hypothetical protein
VASVTDQYYGMNKNPSPTTIILDGGGNDVMSNLGDCQSFDDRCRQVVNEVGCQLGGRGGGGRRAGPAGGA